VLSKSPEKDSRKVKLGQSLGIAGSKSMMADPG
jgi:hypothetical protein